MITKSGYVALVGRPNVGKSTLLNKMIGEKLSITSAKPQTTRMQILGIKTTDEAQIVFVDTPGLHHEEQKNAMNRYMNRIAHATLQEADIIIFIIDATGFRQADENVLEKIKHATQPVILVMNKIDLLKDKSSLLQLINQLKDRFPFAAIIPLSALKKEGVASLEKEVINLLPQGEQLFPEDEWTDKSIRFLAAEMIREKLIRLTNKELPYATTVEIERYVEDEKLIEINALIWVEREGQKIIVIGKGGTVLKKIGTQARHDIERLVGKKVFLRIWVRIKENWTDDEKSLKQFGYD